MARLSLLSQVVEWFRGGNGTPNGNGQKELPEVVKRHSLIPEAADDTAARSNRTSDLDHHIDGLIHTIGSLTENLGGLHETAVNQTEHLRKISDALSAQGRTQTRLTDALQTMPEMVRSQITLTEQGNALLQRQVRSAELLVERFAELRAALMSIEQSAEMHLKCLSELQSHHEKVLREYQALLLRQNRRMAWFFALGLVVSAFALGGVAALLWMHLG